MSPDPLTSSRQCRVPIVGGDAQYEKSDVVRKRNIRDDHM